MFMIGRVAAKLIAASPELERALEISVKVTIKYFSVATKPNPSAKAANNIKGAISAVINVGGEECSGGRVAAKIVAASPKSERALENQRQSDDFILSRPQGQIIPRRRPTTSRAQKLR